MAVKYVLKNSTERKRVILHQLRKTDYQNILNEDLTAYANILYGVLVKTGEYKYTIDSVKFNKVFTSLANHLKSVNMYNINTLSKFQKILILNINKRNNLLTEAIMKYDKVIKTKKYTQKIIEGKTKTENLRDSYRKLMFTASAEIDDLILELEK